MIPTSLLTIRHPQVIPRFQSRNRETYDSNNIIISCLTIATASRFNLVIEKLMIPTNFWGYGYGTLCWFQSRNRETYDSNGHFHD